MPGSLLLGIDIGTSSSKGVLCTPEGEILAYWADEKAKFISVASESKWKLCGPIETITKRTPLRQPGSRVSTAAPC